MTPRPIARVVPANAEPKAEPTCRTVLCAADAAPDIAWGTATMTVEVSWAAASPRPSPYTAIVAAMRAAGVDGVRTSAVAATPATSSTKPSTTTEAAPSAAARCRAAAPDAKAPMAIAANTQPAASTSSPATKIRNRGITNTRANSPTATIAAATLPHVKVGRANSPRSRMTPRPARARFRWTTMNATSMTRPSPSATGTGDTAAVSGQVRGPRTKTSFGRHQPRSVPSMSPNTSRLRAPALRTSPARSKPTR